MSSPLTPDNTASRRFRNDGPVARFVADRESILGSFRVHGDPAIAAAQIVQAMGNRIEARRWVLAVMERLAAMK